MDRSCRAYRPPGRHDGQFLYLRLQEHTDTSKIVRDRKLTVWSGDDWEIFFSPSDSGYTPYRQTGIDVFGRSIRYAYPLNGRSTWWDVPIKVHSDATDPTCWTVYVSYALAGLPAGGESLKPGDSVFMNIVRATRGKPGSAAMWIPTLAPRFYVPERLGRVVLAPPAR